MEELLRQLEQNNNEDELFEALLTATLEPETMTETATAIAARIQAGRDIRFDLQKVIKENENRNKRGLRPEGTGKKAATPKVHA